MPQPSVGFSLQRFPLAEIARLSRGRWLPCGHPPTCEDAPVRAVHRPFHRRPHPRVQLPGSPDDYEVLFRAPRRAPQLLRARTSGTVLFRQLHPLRSVLPPASPFAPTQVAPVRRSILSWAFSSLEVSPPRLGACPRARPEGHTRRPHPKDRTCDSRDLATPRAG
jgi:hypothetical protein